MCTFGLTLMHKYVHTYTHATCTHKVKDLRVGLKLDEATVRDRLKPRREEKLQLSNKCPGLECASEGRTLAWKTQSPGFDAQHHIDQVGREKIARLFPAHLATVQCILVGERSTDS